MSRIVSFWVLVGIIFLVVIVFFKLMATFLIPMFLAAILCVMFGPLHNWFVHKCKGRQKIAAGLTTATVVLGVLVPLVLVVFLAILEGRDIVARVDANAIKEKAEKIRTSLKLDLPLQPEFETIEESLDDLSGDVKTQNWHEKNLMLVQLEQANDELDRQWAADPDEQVATLHEDSSAVFQMFGTYRAQIDNCEIQVAILSAGNADPEAILEAETKYRTALRSAVDQFHEFKTDMMGGRFWAAAKEFANPTAEDTEKYASQIQGALTDRVFSVGSATTSFVVRMGFGLFIMVISFYFFLLDGPKMIASFMKLSPLNDEYERELFDEFQKVSRAVVIATLLSAVVQGILAGLGFYVCGVGSVFLLMILTTVLAMVPFVGAAAVWIPVTLWLFFVDGRPGWAIVLGIYGASIISMADNVIKPMVLHGQSNLHPLLALLSVLGGVTALGPIGILVGPMIVVFLQVLLDILQRELTRMDSERENDDGSETKASKEIEAKIDPAPG